MNVKQKQHGCRCAMACRRTESRTLTSSLRAKSRRESMLSEVWPRWAPVGWAGEDAAATAAAVDVDMVLQVGGVTRRNERRV